MTGFNVKIDQAQDEEKPQKAPARPSFIESILGKRKAKTALVEEGDDNIVSKIETRENNDDGMISFEKTKAEKKAKKDSNELPQSLVERYGQDMKMSKREQRRHQNSSKRAADTYSIDPDSAMGRS